MKDFADKVCMITGAGSGIGRALARELARRGARVISADVNGEAAEETAALVAKDRGQTAVVKLDVTDREAVAAAVNEAVSRHGRLDYLFNNAGIGVGGEARDYSYEDWKKVIDVNLYGVVNGVAAAYPIMVKQGSGHIVNTSSMAGLVPFPGEISYTTSKYAVVGLSHALRIEGADLGVKVSVVCPGKIETPIYQTSRIIGFDKDKVLAMWPKGITAEECAQVILKGVMKNQATIPVTKMTWAAWALARISPDLVIGLGKIYFKKMRTARIEN